jgi:hypothetical protein
MRDLSQFGAKDWLTAKPFVATFKEWRDAAVRDLYCRKRPPTLDRFLADTAHLRHGQVAVIIAYQQAWLIERMARRLARYVPGITPIICDNSRTAEARAEIARVCETAGVHYLPLPPSPVRNINRSHGNAVNWVYRNLILALEPEIFALLDHDIFPTAPDDLTSRLGDQPFYGLKLDQGLGWALWAGFSVYRLAAIRDFAPDFNPDMDRGLVTGGRNFNRIYRHFDPAALRFAFQDRQKLPHEGVAGKLTSEFVDGWIHIWGSSHDRNKMSARGLYEAMLATSE